MPSLLLTHSQAVHNGKDTSTRYGSRRLGV
jgi:hypothetical protein